MTTRTIEEYGALPYAVKAVRNEDGFFARVEDLPGCMTWTDRIEDLWPMVEDAKRAWIEDALEDGDPVPEPRGAQNPAGGVVVQMPESLRRNVLRRAAQEGVTVDDFVASTLARAVGDA